MNIDNLSRSQKIAVTLALGGTVDRKDMGSVASLDKILNAMKIDIDTALAQIEEDKGNGCIVGYQVVNVDGDTLGHYSFEVLDKRTQAQKIIEDAGKDAEDFYIETVYYGQIENYSTVFEGE